MRFTHIAVCLAAVSLPVFVCWVPAAALPLSGLTVAGSEKGLYFGVDRIIGDSNLVELGALRFAATVANVDLGLSSRIPVRVTGTGLRLSYQRFFFSTARQSGPFVQAGLTVMSLGAEAPIDLGSLTYTTSGLELTCTSCGVVSVRTSPRAVDLIPSLGLGWQSVLSRDVRMRLLIGAQYYNVSSAEWSGGGYLPRFAEYEIRQAVRRLNKDIAATSDIYPTASLSLTYSF